MRVKAQAKWLRIGTRKLRRVLDQMRGRPVEEALLYLKFLPQKGARMIEKAVKSAAANATNNYKLNRADLYIAEAYADEAPMFKRMQPRARGRGFPIKKRNSHLTIWVEATAKKEAV